MPSCMELLWNWLIKINDFFEIELVKFIFLNSSLVLKVNKKIELGEKELSI